MTRAGVPAIEGREALADPGAAAHALRHERQAVERAGRILLRNAAETWASRVWKRKASASRKLVEHAMDEAGEDGGIHAHRARGVEQHDEAQRLLLALALQQAERHAAVARCCGGWCGADRCAVPCGGPGRGASAGCASACARRSARPGRLADLLGIGDLAEIDRRQGSRLRRRLRMRPSPLRSLLARRRQMER